MKPLQELVALFLVGYEGGYLVVAAEAWVGEVGGAGYGGEGAVFPCYIDLGVEYFGVFGEAGLESDRADLSLDGPEDRRGGGEVDADEVVLWGMVRVVLEGGLYLLVA